MKERKATIYKPANFQKRRKILGIAEWQVINIILLFFDLGSNKIGLIDKLWNIRNKNEFKKKTQSVRV